MRADVSLVFVRRTFDNTDLRVASKRLSIEPNRIWIERNSLVYDMTSFYVTKFGQEVKDLLYRCIEVKGDIYREFGPCEPRLLISVSIVGSQLPKVAFDEETISLLSALDASIEMSFEQFKGADSFY